MLKRLFVAALLCLPLSAFGADYTDIWWAPPEGGSAVNFVQNQDLLFLTFYVYGPNNQPIWYTATLNADANGNFSGNLYVSTGSYFAAPFNPALFNAAQVGAASFHPINSYQGTLTYSVNGVQVTKSIRRFPFKPIIIGGNYLGGFSSTVTQCNNSNGNTVTIRAAEFRVLQSTADNFVSIDFYLLGNNNSLSFSCNMQGTYEQNGQLYQLNNGRYSCTTGLNTGVVLSDLKATAQGIEATWAANTGNGCFESGRFAGVLE